MSENGSDKLTTKAKRTVMVPDRNHTSSQDGLLPMRPVSVAAAPWEDAVVYQKPSKTRHIGPVLKGPRPGKLKKD